MINGLGNSDDEYNIHLDYSDTQLDYSANLKL